VFTQRHLWREGGLPSQMCQSKNAKRGRELSDFKLSGSASSIQAQIEPPIFLAFPNHLMT